MSRIPSPEQIIALLKSAPEAKLSLRALEAKTKVSREQRKKLRNVLRALVSRKKLHKLPGNIYSLEGPRLFKGGKKKRVLGKHSSSGPQLLSLVGRALRKNGKSLLKVRSPKTGKWKQIAFGQNLPLEIHSGDLVSATIFNGEGAPLSKEALGKDLQPEANWKAKFGALVQKHQNFSDVSKEFFKEWEIPFDFPKEVVVEASEFDVDSIVPTKKRLDCRKDNVIAIDPFGAKDHDDAICVRPRKNGGWELDVHIADVAQYVTADSAIYEEASQRCFTRYLPWKAVPMLPHILSSNICSLMPGQPRYAFSCLMKISADGKIEGYQFAESLVEVKNFYTYEESIEELKKGNKAIIQLRELALALNQRRKKAGLLEFDLPESKVELDKQGQPKSIYLKERVESYMWIEECMLVANICCAKFLKKNKLPGLYRVHEPPEPEDIREFLRHLGDLQSARKGNTLINELKSKKSHIHQSLRGMYINALESTSKAGRATGQLHRSILKSMKKAEYVRSSAGHFALGFPDYAHFTSPIRRFSDLWNHRLMKLHLRGKKMQKHFKEEADVYGGQTSSVEIEVMKLERRSFRCAMSYILTDFLGAEFLGTVTDLDDSGVTLFLECPFIYGDIWLPLSRFRDDYYLYDKHSGMLKGRRTHSKIKLNQKMRLQLVKTNPALGQMDFDLLEKL